MSSCQLDKKSPDYRHSYLKTSAAGGSTSPGHSENMIRGRTRIHTLTHSCQLWDTLNHIIEKSLQKSFSVKFHGVFLSTTGERPEIQLVSLRRGACVRLTEVVQRASPSFQGNRMR